MWLCPGCGDHVFDYLDACSNCGMARDETAADDLEPEPGSASELPEEEEVEDVPPQADRIVELCSAANTLEAYHYRNLLDEADIQARVVNDFLINAAGKLPFGETISPRVWIHESDAECAREFLAGRLAESETEQPDWPDRDATREWEVSHEPESDAQPSGQGLRLLNQGFWIAAFLCVAVGVLWAWQNHTILSEYPATTSGRWVGFSEYAYMVDGRVYYVQANNASNVRDAAIVHYSPRQPLKHLIGPVKPPLMILSFAMVLAAFLAFVAYQFR